MHRDFLNPQKVQAISSRSKAETATAAPVAQTTLGTNMILELATLDIKPGQEAAFERDFHTASKIIQASPGYLDHELQRCIEKPGRYVLLVRWENLSAHTDGFRKSAPYAEWKRLLHHYYDPFPTVEHYALVDTAAPDQSTGPAA